MVENEIDCYDRVESVSFLYCDLYNFGLVFIGKDLKYRYEGLGKEKFNLLKYYKWFMFFVLIKFYLLKEFFKVYNEYLRLYEKIMILKIYIICVNYVYLIFVEFIGF